MAAIALTRGLYFTTRTVIGWVDIFTRPAYKHIVERPEEYLYSSARNCAGIKGLLNVIVAP